MTHLLRRRVLLVLVVVASAALVPRLILLEQLRTACPTFDQPEGGDSIFYDRVAKGEPVRARAYFHSPLYQWFVSAIYGAAGRDLWLVRFIQSLFGVAAALLVTGLTYRLFRRWDVAGGAGLLQALFGPGLLYESQLLPDALLPALAAGSGLALVVYIQRRTIRSAALLGVLVGLAALARPTILIWIPAVLAWMVLQWMLRSPFQPRLAPQTIALLGAAAIVILPVTLRNYLIERDLVLITANSGLNLYIGNNPNARGTYNLPRGMWFRPGDPLDDFSGIHVATTALGHKPSSSELSSWWSQKALDYLREEPARALQLAAMKAALWLNDYEQPQLYNYYGYRDVAPVLRVLPTAGLIIVPGLPGLVLVFWLCRRSAPRLYAICVVLFAAGFVPFFVVGRYRAAWLALLAPLAAWSVALTVRSLRRRRLRRVAAMAALAAAGAAVAFWPPAVHPNRAYQYHAFGYAEAERGNLEEAVRWYRKAAAEGPDYWSVNARLARTLSDLGRHDEALRVIEEARERGVRTGQTAKVAGLVHRRLGDLATAERELIDAIRQEPSLTEAWIVLARVKAARGDKEAAADAYRSALTLAHGDEDWVPEARRRLQALTRATRSP